MFWVYMNDFPHRTNCNTTLYADDIVKASLALKQMKAGPAKPPPKPPGRRGGRPGQGPRPEHRGVFFFTWKRF